MGKKIFTILRSKNLFNYTYVYVVIMISGAVEDQVFDAVLVCTGHHAMPHRPTFPGLEKYLSIYYATNLEKIHCACLWGRVYCLFPFLHLFTSNFNSLLEVP